MTAVQGFAGVGIHRLVLDLDVPGHPRLEADEAVVAALTAEVFLETDTTGIRSLGAGRFEDAVILRATGDQAHLMLPLTGGQVEEVEDLRAGGPLQLRIDVAGVLSLPDPAPTAPGLIHEQVTGTIAARDWAHALDQAGALTTTTVTLVLPAGSGERHTKIHQRLRRGRQALVDGNWVEAVTSCRRALEAAGLAPTALRPAAKQADAILAAAAAARSATPGVTPGQRRGPRHHRR